MSAPRHQAAAVSSSVLNASAPVSAANDDPSALYRAGMRRLAAGVCVITTTDAAGAPHGLVATAVTSVSAEPPVLLVCVNRSASSHPVISACGRFCVNVLGVSDAAVAERFSGADKRLRFLGREWVTLATGAPALSGCLASFDCRITECVEAATHTVFFGQVEHTRLWECGHDPLLYWGGAYGRAARGGPAGP